MVIWMAISFVSSSLSFIYIRLGKQKEMAIVDICHLIIVLASLYLGHYLYQNDYYTLLAYTIAQSVFYLFAILLAYVFLNDESV